MGVKNRLSKAEQRVERFYDTLTLTDGTQIPIAEGELLEAILAVLERSEHRLLPHLRDLGHTKKGLPGLIWAMETGEARACR